MRILLTGANGYIGKRLLPVLVEAGHEVICLVRSRKRLSIPDELEKNIQVVVGDLLDPASLSALPEDIDYAFYLVHSMSHTARDFSTLEATTATNFVEYLKHTRARQIVYLSGIVNDEDLSEHLQSRQNVGTILRESGIPATVLRAGIIIGSGSASFEIIRDLVEKLPVMVAPKWVKNRIQPIAIYDVIHYLCSVLGDERCLNRTFDIGGPDVLNYKEMMLQFARVRNFRRYIIDVPLLTPKLSSYWLYFVTSTSFSLAQSLVDSLKNEVVCENDEIQEIIPHRCLSYEDAVQRAFSRIAENAVVSSWKDAWVSGRIGGNLKEYVQVPENGCLEDVRTLSFDRPAEQILENIWSIGGDRGWYHLNWLWRIRGVLDKLLGGVGLRRARANQRLLEPGDALDFWRVLLADRERMRLLLYAEMKLPGEAWLEFRISPNESGGILHQKATFRPNGLAGRIYWYSILPFHYLVFGGMMRGIINYRNGSKAATTQSETGAASSP